MVSYTVGNLPHSIVHATDIELQRLVSFAPSTGGLLLRRDLTGEERGMLEARRYELEDCLRPFAGAQEEDRVALALLEMFGSFPSMRATEEEAAARVESIRRLLGEFPAWAIEKACHYIRFNGVERKGERDRQWPPSDGELVAEIARELETRKLGLSRAVALLEARVDDIDLRRNRPPPPGIGPAGRRTSPTEERS